MSNAYYQFEWRQYSQQNRITRAVQRLILLTTLTFSLQLLILIPFGFKLGNSLAPSASLVTQWFALQPHLVLQGWIWQPITYLFLHDGLMHLFGNMLVLFFFGPDVERILSTRKFYRFYVFCGLGGAAAAIAWAVLRANAVSIVGASGAVSGIMVAFAVAYPHREVFIFPFPVPIKAWFLVVIILFMNVFMSGDTKGVSVPAHLGGMAAGFLYMKAVPKLRDWQEKRLQNEVKPKDGLERLGEAVDNIFKFEQKGRRK
ncbi:MAG: hypothetical protein AMXMBFR84_11290 [Candidatus Hydrogenedentota bacterium]